jgi:hypothetical protein
MSFYSSYNFCVIIYSFKIFFIIFVFIVVSFFVIIFFYNLYDNLPPFYFSRKRDTLQEESSFSELIELNHSNLGTANPRPRHAGP